MRQTVRLTAALLATVLSIAAVLWSLAWLARPDLTQPPPPYSPERLAQAEQLRDVSFDPRDPAQLPVLVVDESELGSEQPRARDESPILAELVDDGVLPPVGERVGPEPVVLRGVDGPGVYGGTWLRIATAPEDVSTIEWRLSYSGLFRWSPLGYPVVPHLAKRLVVEEDHRAFRVEIRRGIRWSDGQPFTADDVLYWWEYEALDDTVGEGAAPAWMRVAGQPGTIEKIDDHTLRFRFAAPYGNFEEALACFSYLMVRSPRHYLSRYHPSLGDSAFIEREMRAYRLPSSRSLYAYAKHFQNPEHPRMWPWIYRGYRSTPPQVFVRNPYYPAVDELGNQLPYIDRLQFDVVSGQMMPVAFTSGRVSMQARHVRYDNYTELLGRADPAGYRVLHWYPATRSVWMINPNHDRRVDPARPGTKWKAQLLGDKRFRQALSLAINREAIIQAEYNNQVRPSQVEPGPESPFHHAPLGEAYTRYDPDRAAAMLDELGLIERDVDGMRTFPDGTGMTFFLDFTQFTGMGPAQFVVDDWAEVGIRVIARERARTLFEIENTSGDFDFMIWSSESDYFPLIDPRTLVPSAAKWAWAWSRWYARGGFYGDPLADPADAPPQGHPIREAIALYEQALQSPDPQAQKRLLGSVMDIAAEQLWTINIAEAPPQLVVVDRNMRNVPRNALYAARAVTPGNAGLDTYYFERPFDTPGTIRETRDAIVAATPRPRPGAVAAAADLSGDASAETATSGRTSAAFVGRLLRWSVVGIGVLLLTMVAIRHPFVARRLLIMAPTLLVISVIVFTIIQLPPGDYLTSRLIQLTESGEPGAEQEIEDLRRLFHFDEPVWQRYLRWMGLRWFLSFDDADAGLLQGNMGRSMETTEPVNSLVGDRIMLTFLISLGTILFTWTLAIPIGVFSAVRQYSTTDYALTLIGFVGMSVPGFLLALVLMSVAGVGVGLFSPQFAAQPDWDWPKVVDLMKHIWIPVVVLGVGGTASMIRVMRANLLDELKKPYVTTARAKGVRPVKLLFKYPVRVALNPFVSGIGSLFPQLVSGGAIVAMVLALPTVGPLLLAALFSQDMYLAGSMLMVLSLLAVFGTLVSDLLLLWLDPRIRYEGAGA